MTYVLFEVNNTDMLLKQNGFESINKFRGCIYQLSLQKWNKKIPV